MEIRFGLAAQFKKCVTNETSGREPPTEVGGPLVVWTGVPKNPRHVEPNH